MWCVSRARTYYEYIVDCVGTSWYTVLIEVSVLWIVIAKKSTVFAICSNDTIVRMLQRERESWREQIGVFEQLKVWLPPYGAAYVTPRMAYTKNALSTYAYGSVSKNDVI